MSVRLQFRRGTASQWTAANPTLFSGEVGVETDTKLIKIGDGSTAWNSLVYATVSPESLVEQAQDSINTALVAGTGLDKTYNDGDNTITIDIDSTVATKTYADTAVSTHSSDSTSVHGITDTTELATKAFAAELLTNSTKTNITITGDKTGLVITAENGVADSTTDNLTEGSTNKYFTDERAQDAIGNSIGTGLSYNDTTGAISVDTTAIQARVTDVSDTEIGYLNGVTSAIQTQLDDKSTASKTETLTNKTLTSPTVSGLTLSDSSIVIEGSTANDFETTLTVVDPTADRTITLPDETGTVQLRVTDVSDTEIGYLNGVTSAIQTQMDAKAPLAGPALTGDATAVNLTVSGNLTVNGTTTNLNSTNLVIEDKNIVLGDTETPTDTTADGGGITLKGATDKTFNWVDATDAWTSSENLNLASGKSLYVNGTLLKDSSETLTNKTINATSNTITVTSANVSDFNEAAQDAIGNSVGTGLSYNDTTGAISVDTTAIQAKVANVDDTEIGYLNGVTSSIQTQLDAKSTESKTETLTNKTLTSPVVSGLTLSDSSIVIEGSTANDFETTITVTDPTADRTITLPDASGTVALTSDIVASEVTASSTNTFTNKSISLTTNPVTGTKAEFNTAMSDADFATIDGTETLTNKTLTTPVISSITNSAATLTLPTSTGTLALTTDIPSGVVTESGTQTLTNKTLTSPIVTGLSLNDSSVVFEGSSADDNETTLTVTNPTADRTITLPDASGTVALTGTSVSFNDITATGNLSVTGDLTVSGTTTSINTTNLEVKDKNILLAKVGPLTISESGTIDSFTGEGLDPFSITITGLSSTTGVVAGMNVTATAGTGGFGTGAESITVASVSSGTSIVVTQIGGTSPTVGTITNIIVSGSDVTANGAGLTVQGTTNKTFNWVDSTDAFTSSEHIALANGKSFYGDLIGNVTGTATADASALTGTALNSPIVTSSLTTVGTITTGTWSASTIALDKGGTGATTQSGAINALLPSQTSNVNKILKTDGTDVSWTDAPSVASLTTSADLTVGDQAFIGAGAPAFAGEADGDLTNAALVVRFDNGTADSTFAQIAFQNDDATSSTDIITYMDNGNDSNGWMGMGIAGSNFDDETYGITSPGDGYIFHNAIDDTYLGNIVIATGAEGSENKIIFAAGGFDSGLTQMEITPGVNVHVEIPTPSISPTTGAFTVVGGVGIQGDMNIQGNVAIEGTITFGGAGTTVETANLSVTDPAVFVGTNNQADTVDLSFIGEYATSVSTITKTVSNKALTSNIATLTTSEEHTYLAGDVVVVSGVDGTFNGTYNIIDVPTTTTFTYAKTASNVTSVAASGTAAVSARRKFAGIARDASDGIIKVFKDGTTKPTSTVNFAEAGLAFADMRIGGLTASSATIGSVTNTEIGYLSGTSSAIQTQLDAKAVYPVQTSQSGKYLTTNGTSTSWATVDALPSQSGNSGKYLTTNGTAATWAPVSTDPMPQILMMMGA
jgi:hypothetical protein